MNNDMYKTPKSNLGDEPEGAYIPNEPKKSKIVWLVSAWNVVSVFMISGGIFNKLIDLYGIDKKMQNLLSIGPILIAAILFVGIVKHQKLSSNISAIIISTLSLYIIYGCIQSLYLGYGITAIIQTLLLFFLPSVACVFFLISRTHRERVREIEAYKKQEKMKKVAMNSVRKA